MKPSPRFRLLRSTITFTSLLLLLVTAQMVTARMVTAQSAATPVFDPPALYLTWQQDPSTTMTIDWHVGGGLQVPVIWYRRASGSAAGTTPGSAAGTTSADFSPEALPASGADAASGAWSVAEGDARPFPFSEKTIYRVELTGLTPDTEYEFSFGAVSRVYRFRTMPSGLSRPIRIAVGGDSMHQRDWMERTGRVARDFEPDFAIIGGDMAYEDGLPPALQANRDTTRAKPENYMYEWFYAYKNSMIEPDGRVIPMLVIAGNHEVRGGYFSRDDRRTDLPPYQQNDESRAQVAPYFYSAFAMPGQPGYNVLDFGSYLSILLLDSDHSNPVEGTQTQWLSETLSSREHIRHIVPVYHVPAWPSVRDFSGITSERVRQNWVPLFESHGVRIAFENHDHAWKRTYPIRAGTVDPSGVTYFGDGAWGVSTRTVHDKSDPAFWYLNEAQSVRHVMLLTIDGETLQVQTWNENGEIIDEIRF